MTRKDFVIACLCFRRARQPLKENIAAAHLKEIEGLELKAKEEVTASRTKFEEAVATFVNLKLISHATRLLIQLNRLENAAEL